MSLLQQIQTWKTEKEDAICVLIDMQTKLLPAMSDPQTVERNVIRLIQGMKALGIPTVVTQQYTKGLGPTVPAVAEALGAFEPIDKTSFSCMDLIREGYRVALVADCIDSRDPLNKERTILRLAQEGVVITTYESVLYELLGSAKAPEFKAISAIVK